MQKLIDAMGQRHGLADQQENLSLSIHLQNVMQGADVPIPVKLVSLVVLKVLLVSVVSVDQ